MMSMGDMSCQRI